MRPMRDKNIAVSSSSLAVAKASWPAFVVALLLYSPFLGNPHFLDDWHLLESAERAEWTPAGLTEAFSFLDSDSLALWHVPEQEGYHFFRPFVVATYKLDMALWGQGPVGLHLTNLIVHLFNIILATALIFRCSGDFHLARLGALLWVVNPQAAVAVLWTAGRTELLSTFFVLTSLHCYAMARDHRRPFWLGPSLALQALALLSKESGVLITACFAVYEISIIRTRQKRDGGWQWTTMVTHLTPSALVTVGYLAFRFLIFHPHTMPNLGGYFHSPLEPGFLEFVSVKLPYVLFSAVSGALVVPLLGVDFLRSQPWVLAILLCATFALFFLLVKKTSRGPTQLFFWLILACSLLPTLPVLATDLHLYLPTLSIGVLLARAFLSPRNVAQKVSEKGWLSLGRWRRRALFCYIAFFVLGNLGRSFMYREQGLMSERAFEDIVAEIGDIPRAGARFYFINMPVVASHLMPMLRLRRGAKDVRAVLVTVSTAWVDYTASAEVECLSPNHLRVHPPAGQDAFFSTREEWYLQLQGKPVQPNMEYKTVGARIRPIAHDGHIKVLDIFLDRTAEQDNVHVFSFYDDGNKLARRVCATKKKTIGKALPGEYDVKE